ncbi:MAG: RNA polymerase subunit sigma-24 [Pyrinomonas sp.]|uniref:RNA polymerase sigma factor n=1 Tax=Pyrinomonas sp. TaxID=2080306 RepID=UPI003324E872
MDEAKSTSTVETNAAPSALCSDATLAARACAGDEAAFEELFNRHRRRVALIAGRFFRRREQIEEIVQESFTKAYFALKDFVNAQEQSFAAWIARIAFNACYDELRRAARRPENATGEPSDEEAEWLREKAFVAGPEHDVEASAIARDLAEKLLSRLNPEDRLLLVMLEVEEMSVAEIAAITRWSPSKVKVRAHRARLALRRALRRLL